MVPPSPPYSSGTNTPRSPAPPIVFLLRRWGALSVSAASSPFALLSTQIGHDCAGAVQFCAPDEVDELIGRPGTVDPLTEGLRRVAQGLASRHGHVARPGLHGAVQPHGRTGEDGALLRRGPRRPARWVGSDDSHILKPAVIGLEGHDLNEHLCSRRHVAAVCPPLAPGSTPSRARGRSWSSATTAARWMANSSESTRRTSARRWGSTRPASTRPTVGLHRRHRRAPAVGHADGADAVGRFVDALAFNWISTRGPTPTPRTTRSSTPATRPRLAPLYDIASALPYDTSQGHKLGLAMKLGGEYRLLETDRPSTWKKVAEEVGLPHDAVVARVARLAEDIGPAFAEVAADPAVVALGSDLPTASSTPSPPPRRPVRGLSDRSKARRGGSRRVARRSAPWSRVRVRAEPKSSSSTRMRRT